jgi:23S rRNA (adenine2503-C2)-methyltransferase
MITPASSESTQHPVSRTRTEWKEQLLAWGERPFRANQIYRWIHERGQLDPEQMSDLPQALRQRLREAGLTEPGRVESVHRSQDGTRKLLLEMSHGTKVECVLIPMTRGPQSLVEEDEDEEEEAARERITLCVSTQFGCAMGCKFCASGQSGLFRGLGAAEILYQVLVARRYLEPSEQLRNLVFMGMGEPLHHYDETKRALEILTDPEGAAMSPRRITVSTVGLIPGIERLGADFGGKVGLALSLHAPDDETRDKIMPMNKRYPVADLMSALRRYPLPPRRRITIEYLLIDGLNDSVVQAEQLARTLRGIPAKVNLIPMNPIADSEFRAPLEERVIQFRERLMALGVSCFVRTRRGDDVAAACGQLALQTVRPERLVRRKDP